MSRLGLDIGFKKFTKNNQQELFLEKPDKRTQNRNSSTSNKIKFQSRSDLLKCSENYQVLKWATNLLVVFLREELTVALTLITNLILMLKLSNQTQSLKMAGVELLDCRPHWIKHMLFPERFVAPLLKMSNLLRSLVGKSWNNKWRSPLR